MNRRDQKGRKLKTGEEQWKDGRYRYRYTDRYGKRQCIYSWNLVPTDGPEISLREKEKQIQSAKMEGIDTMRADRLTVNDMYEIYMKGRPELKPQTVANYEEIWKSQLAKSIGLKTISRVRYSTIRNFYIDELKTYKFGTVAQQQKILHPVFDLAVRDGLIRSNPTNGALKGLRQPQEQRHALTKEEQTIFMEFLETSNTYRKWKPFYTILLGTGMRIGEMVGLTWQDVDFKKHLISVNHQLNYQKYTNELNLTYHITEPKTKAGIRTIPMMKDVEDAFLKVKKEQAERGFCIDIIDGYKGFCFCSSNRHVFCESTIRSNMALIKKACNRFETEKAKKEEREPIIITKLTPHILRHTFATRLCEQDVNIKVIQSVLGHSDIETTMNIYAEATDQKKQEEFVNLEGIL